MRNFRGNIILALDTLSLGGDTLMKVPLAHICGIFLRLGAQDVQIQVQLQADARRCAGFQIVFLEM